MRGDWPMLRLLSDPRVALDPTRATAVPALLVLALNDALDVHDEADYLASKPGK